MWAKYMQDWEPDKGTAAVPTNADRIRAMSDEELAKLLCILGWGLGEMGECLAWLQQSAPKEEQNV